MIREGALLPLLLLLLHHLLLHLVLHLGVLLPVQADGRVEKFFVGNFHLLFGRRGRRLCN